MHRAKLLALLAIGGGVAAAAYGCGDSEPALENLCGWLGDPNSCARTFHEHVGAQCGAFGRGNGPVGSFLGRDKLDVCVLSQGGQVVLDPAPTVANFPLTGPIKIKIMDGFGQECGVFDYSGTFTFDATVDNPNGAGGFGGAGGAPPCQDFAGALPDAGTTDAGASDAGPTTQFCGGTFAETTPDGRDTLDTTCPGNETHHFNRLQISKCPEYTDIFPRAELESKAGGIDHQGLITFRIIWPPAPGESQKLENAKGSVVEYFNCSIPAAPKPCQNGVKDIGETDIDCGGPVCDPCADGQACAKNTDCLSKQCLVDPMGLKKCGPTTSGAGGMGGKGAGGAGGLGGKGGKGGTGG